MNEDRSSSTSTILLAFAGGTLLGAGLALLFAPQSGRKTRQDIGDLAEEGLDKAQDLRRQASQGLDKARQQGEKWVGEAKEFVEEKKVQAASMLDGARR